MNDNTVCKECGKKSTKHYKGFCDDKCHGRYHGKMSLLIDYGTESCPTCGDTFNKKATNHKYCSNGCTPDYTKKEVVVRHCKKCGCVVGKGKSLCTECKIKQPNKTHRKNCDGCGKDYDACRKDQKYCSKECRYITKDCVSCGDAFKTEDENKQHCSVKCMNNAKKKSHFEFTKELIDCHDGTIVPLEEYKGSDTNLKCLCVKCGNEMEKLARFYIGIIPSGCNSCGNRSHGEEAIEKWLRDNNKEYIRQYSFDDLVYSKRLHYDFALLNNGELKMLIEYDGEQHFKPVKAWGGEEKLQETIVRDEIKNNYAHEIGIPLLRITYKEKKSVPEILNKEINKVV